MPRFASNWDAMMLSVGLDPNDGSADLTTAIGIGNTARRAVAAARERDGMNQLGDEGGRVYNRRPYENYTLFDNKIASLGFSALFITLSRGLSLQQFVEYDFLTNMAAFDGGIATWHEKFRFDAVYTTAVFSVARTLHERSKTPRENVRSARAA
jgi:hypothetical protein